MTRWHRPMALALTLALGAAALPAPVLAQVDRYRQHMENGIKLFQDRNYRAAIVEFDAAYKLRPKASPLFNVALAEKALFHYPRAIAALERALAHHRDTMDANDEKAARSAIEEMRALLARLTVELSPPNATLMIDGEDLPPSDDATRVIELGPGVHRVGARAEGYASVEQSVTLVSGERDKTLKLSLVRDKGLVVVDAGDEATAIAIDSKFVAYGEWEGLLAPGPHLVQLYGPKGVIYSAQVLVAAGKTEEVGPGYGGVPTPALGGPQGSTVTPPPPPPPRPAPLQKSKQGYYVLGEASLLWPLSHPRAFPRPEANSGGAGSLRVGYRVNIPAAFDLMFQYANVATGSKDPSASSASYTLASGRFGLNVRLMTPGQTWRFVGSIGGGLTYDDVSFYGIDRAAEADPCKGGCVDGAGINAFIFSDVGFEVDLGGVLLGFSLDSYFQSSRGITYEDPVSRDERPLYETGPLLHFGGSLHAGYAFW